MFKTFPEFSKLTLNDKDEYDALVKDYPPVGDISFSVLMTWWDVLGKSAVALLNGNLVLSYWLPGDEEQSGLSVIGTKNIDQSVCAIFDYLRERGERPRLVNVPAFVVNSMQYPELFTFKDGSGHDEYIVALSKYAQLENLPLYMRVRIRKFIREHGDNKIQVKNIDLRSFVNRQLLLEASERWPLRGVNNMSKFGRQFLPEAVKQCVALNLECVGMYIENTLQAYCFYSRSKDGQYVTLLCARVNYDIPRIFDYIVHGFGKYWASQGVVYVNLYSDNGSPVMRIIKIGLKPDNFFRKYKIEPA